MRAVACAIRIGDGWVIEDVEELDPELGAVSLLERKSLEDGEIPVLKAHITEDVPAHRAEALSRGRNHHGIADHVAAARRQRGKARAIRYARCRDRRGELANGAVNPGYSSAFYTRQGSGSGTEASAVGQGARSGLEVRRAPKEILAVRGLSGGAEIVARV